jgi:hypothetical protein
MLRYKMSDGDEDFEKFPLKIHFELDRPPPGRQDGQADAFR